MATYFSPYDSIPSEIEFENFNGQDVDGWLYKIESFFNQYQLAPIQVIHNYLKGEATEWHYEMYMDWRLTTWESFVRDLKIRFKPPETRHSPSQVSFTPSSDEQISYSLIPRESKCQAEYKSEDTQESIGEEVVLTKDESESELEVTIEAIPTVPSIVILTEVVILQGYANPVFVTSSAVLYMDLYCCIPSVCQIDPMKISSYSNMLCHLKDGQNTLCERTIGVLKLASLNKPPPLPPEIEKGYRGCSGQTSMILNHAYFLESEIHASNDFGMIALEASGMQIQGLSLRQNLDVHQWTILLSTHAQLESPFLGVLILTKTRVIDVSAYANKNHSLTGYSNEMNCEVYYAANLVTGLYCLARIEFIDEDGCYYVVCTTFVQFLELMRKLHMNCCFASAGSHRVWGFSEYNSISFLFQSSQLFDHKYMMLESIHTAYISRKFALKYMHLPYADIEMKVKKRLLTEHLSLPGCEFYLEQRQCQICITATPILGFTIQLHNRNGIAVSKLFVAMIVVVKCAKGWIFLNSFCFKLLLNKYGIRQCMSTFSTLILWVEELHYDFSCMSYKLWKKQLSEWVKTLVRNEVNSESKFACEALPYALMGVVGDLLSSSYKEFVTYWVLISVAYYTVLPVQNYFDWMQLHTTPNKNKVFKQNYQLSCQFNTYLVAMNYVYFLLTNIFQRTIGTKHTDGHCASHTSTVIYNLYIMELLCVWKVWGMVVSDTHQVLARDDSLSYHSKSILYSMMRFDSVKNMADLVGYGRHQSLIELAHFSMLQLDQMKSTAGYIFVLQLYLAYNVLVDSEERQQKCFYIYWGILSHKKPEAWDDKPYIVDPGDKKPEFDDIPIKILDDDVDKHEGLG